MFNLLYYLDWRIFRFLKCKHDWINYGWSYVQCTKCGLTQYNPNKNAEILDGVLTRMSDRGLWDEEGCDKMRDRSRMFQ